jgi:hypothetical protein
MGNFITKENDSGKFKTARFGFILLLFRSHFIKQVISNQWWLIKKSTDITDSRLG